ncbi:hypothetical protein OK016_24235 [Vibrio chagasii]|nr:hypothetical protein [Vibrio chagasii]
MILPIQSGQFSYGIDNNSGGLQLQPNYRCRNLYWQVYLGETGTFGAGYFDVTAILSYVSFEIKTQNLNAEINLSPSNNAVHRGVVLFQPDDLYRMAQFLVKTMVLVVLMHLLLMRRLVKHSPASDAPDSYLNSSR